MMKVLQKSGFVYLNNKGNKGEELAKICIRKLKHCLKINVKFVPLYDTKK